MSEMELSILRQRSLEALRQKARRGELFLSVAVGYVKVRRDRIAKDPDLRVREAIGLVFRKFAEFQSIRQVHLWLRQEAVLLPAVEANGEGRRIVWKLPVYNTVHGLLTNPVYGGAYAFGRTESRVTVENGRKRISRGHRRDREAWDVLIVDHHEGYLSWAEFERNQRLIADNANCRGLMARGAVRRGEALLAGLLRCGHCGRRLHVFYSGTDGCCVRYGCRGARINHGTGPCIAFGGLRVDAAVSAEVLRLLNPLGVEAALGGDRDAGRGERRDAATGGAGACPGALRGRPGAPSVRRWSIRRTALSPANSNGAGTTGWRRFIARKSGSLPWRPTGPDALSVGGKGQADGARRRSRDGLVASGRDRGDAQADPARRHRGDRRDLDRGPDRPPDPLAWRGSHPPRGAAQPDGRHRWSSEEDVCDMIRALARQQVDGAIAATLNRLGKRTGRGNPWTEARVRSFRQHYGVPAHRPGEMAERGELTLEEAARRLDVSKMTVLRLISAGTITAKQVCKGAPWAVPEGQIMALAGPCRAAANRRSQSKSHTVPIR